MASALAGAGGGPVGRVAPKLINGLACGFDELPGLGQDAELALALVKIESDIVHGWPSVLMRH
jgi:hypothetical protein